jgi:AcrR family transcriptional regulator
MAVLSRRTDTTAQRRAAEARFVEATVALLEGGESYADLSVERIAAAAGRTRTAFYFYFRDKRELLMRATEDVAAGLYSEADRWWSGQRDNAELAEALRRVLALYRANGPLLRAVVEAASYDEVVGRFWDELVGPFIVATERRLQADGGLDRDTAHGKAFVLVWGTERVCHQQVTRAGRMDDDQAVRALVDVWQRTVAG